MVEHDAIEYFSRPLLPRVSSGKFSQLHKTAPFIRIWPWSTHLTATNWLIYVLEFVSTDAFNIRSGIEFTVAR